MSASGVTAANTAVARSMRAHAAQRARPSGRILIGLLVMLGGMSSLPAASRVMISYGAPSSASASTNEINTYTALEMARFAVADAVDVGRTIQRAQFAARVDGALAGRDVGLTARHLARSLVSWQHQYVTVTADDTLQSIAARYALRLDELLLMNPNLEPTRFHVGDRVTVYLYDPERHSSSRGAANRGRLVNGVPMPHGDPWIVRRSDLAYGTVETIEAIVAAYEDTARAHPEGSRPMIGSLSRRTGGRLHPHRSHQSGRDIDAAFYNIYPERAERFTHTSRHDLDAVRQWHLFNYWLERDMVEYIFVDRRLIPSLRREAVHQGASREVLRRAFGDGTGRSQGLIRHSPGHANHYHARFRCAPHDVYCRPQ